MIDKSPLISIVIPNYNYGHFLSEAIESVLNQTYKNIEIIVVDNESTDDSIIIASQYLDLITLLVKEHGGVSSARNLGMSIAKGDYICFLDSDDSWTPEKLEMQLEVAQASQVGVVYSGVNLCDSKLMKEEELHPEYRGDCSFLFFNYPTKAIVLLGCSNALISRNAINEVGEFKSYLHFSADWDFFRRLCKITEVDYVPVPQINYRRHSQSMSSGSIESYYDDNELAIMDFINEIRHEGCQQFSTLRLFDLWRRFQFQGMKALFRNGRYLGSIKRFLRVFQYFTL
jgi:glycosyltransferase involved in cell wall biosynthesis